MRSIVDWSVAAPRRPRHAADPFAPEYRLDDVDELVRNAEQRGIEVLLTIWGTPRWANGGARPNVAPSDPRDLRDFAHALAARYSGRHPGLSVRPLLLGLERAERRRSSSRRSSTPPAGRSRRASTRRSSRPRTPGSRARARTRSSPPARRRRAAATGPRACQTPSRPARFARLVAAAAPRPSLRRVGAPSVSAQRPHAARTRPSPGRRSASRASAASTPRSRAGSAAPACRSG